MFLQKNTFTEIEISYLLDQFFLKKKLRGWRYEIIIIILVDIKGWDYSMWCPKIIIVTIVLIINFILVFLPENIRESAKSESRGESVANRSKVEKNWRILDEAIVISYSVFRLLRIGFNKNLELPLL
ncbi:uncharacterized protein OCT59_026907 [Rhizophagus irregularis]|uniref:uncharacterized protein n=1 Tax=Rhizophagus irregularis TaxID=588596 RepID=UPI003332AB04|nr:hypothetical protein OCT59_026907 [Rhizophagus irregularis]